MRGTETDLDGAVLEDLLGQVHRHTGITMGRSKVNLLRSRLGTRLRALGLDSFGDYLAHLRSHPEEVREFINRVTTNETSFFRTPLIWEFLARQYLVEWSDRTRPVPGACLQVWSAAASTGEEAYSLAMLLSEFRGKAGPIDFRIDASDIAAAVLATGRRGTYDGRSIEDLRSRHPARLKKFFRSVGEGTFEIVPELRARVNFREHSLFTRPPQTGKYDLILLRNVAIYFNDADLQRVLGHVQTALAPGGILILGESESLARFSTPFEFVAPFVYRLNEKSVRRSA